MFTTRFSVYRAIVPGECNIKTVTISGIALDRVQVILGHKTLSMTRRYAETWDEHLRTVIAQAFD